LTATSASCCQSALRITRGYLSQVASSRKLERECQRNLEVIWLLGKLAPDFKTIADFRKDNANKSKG